MYGLGNRALNDWVLTTFGSEALERFSESEGEEALKKIFGPDLKSSLKNLNELHDRFGKVMPYEAPSHFVFIELDPQLFRIDCYSKCSSLTPIVVGLIRGLANHHGVEVEIDSADLATSGANQTLLVNVLHR